MPDILVRGLKIDTVKRLKARAKRHGRSLQGEVKTVLEHASGVDAEQIADMLSGWKKRLSRRKLTDSTALIREDRGR